MSNTIPQLEAEIRFAERKIEQAHTAIKDLERDLKVVCSVDLVSEIPDMIASKRRSIERWDFKIYQKQKEIKKLKGEN